jgi:hypothetical protein
MHLHPYPVLPFVQLYGAGASWNPKMPVMATGTPRQLTLALDDQTALAALGESPVSRDLEVEFEHERVGS